METILVFRIETVWNQCSCNIMNEVLMEIYSSSSSIGTCWPPFAPADDDDRIGPDSFNTDEIMLPEPAEAAGAPPSSLKSAWSSESASDDGTGADPPLKPPKPPLKPPKPPAELPLSAPNFDVIAAIFGWMTAWSNCWSELIGTGGSIPAALFLAMFVWSNWFSRLVFASRIPSIFYKFIGCIKSKLDLLILLFQLVCS